MLCPVRALEFYWQSTKVLSPCPVNLFVSPRCRQRALSEYALSFFLRESISGAGSLGDVVGPSSGAHSIRGVSTSLVFHKNWAVKEFFKAATWRSNSVFASFYLRDVADVWDGCRRGSATADLLVVAISFRLPVFCASFIDLTPSGTDRFL